MSMFYLVLALLFSLIIALVAIDNGENVTVNYLFGQARISLIVLILGSASAGVLTMGFFSLFRGIRTHLNFRETRRNQEELQHRLELLEEEKNRLEAELGRWQGVLFAPKSGRETRENLKKKAVNTAETIKDTVKKKVETVKDSAAHAAQEVSNVIKDIHGKTEGVKKDIKDGCHEITQDIHKTAENTSNDLKSVK